MATASRHLPRVLHLFDISVLASASMGPAYSLASTMGPMVAAAGSSAPVAFVLLSAIMLCVAVAFSALSRVAPNAGSSYSWIRMAFGARAGAYGAWLLLLSNFFATMAIAVPAGLYTLALVAPAHESDPLWAALVGAVWIVASSVLLYVGVRPTALITFLALAFEMIVLLVTAVAAYFVPHHLDVSRPIAAHATPISLAGFLTAMTLAVWMNDGWEVSASTSEEVDDSSSASGRGGIAGLLVSTFVLLACMVAYMHLGTIQGFTDNQTDALAYVGTLLGGGWWRFVIVLTVLLSTLTTLWTTILYLSRSVFAMGRDGLLPRALGDLDGRDEPFWSLAIVAILVTVCEVITGFSKSAADQLQLVLNASSVFLGLLFVLSAAAAVRRFVAERAMRVWGVIVPLAGALALLGVLAATVALEDPVLRWYAWGGVVLGIPFALWRGRVLRG
ncbi:MAG TPA: APC family permease [Candidatus Aquilonibacter sp.]|nr:APC family permease [Candidatus Aquilonibacter sp.]